MGERARPKEMKKLNVDGREVEIVKGSKGCILIELEDVGDGFQIQTDISVSLEMLEAAVEKLTRKVTEYKLEAILIRLTDDEVFADSPEDKEFALEAILAERGEN